MSDYDNTNRGALFPNDKKTADNQPDFTGSINWKGEEIRISGWKKVAKSGNKFISVALSEPRDKEQKPAKASSDDGWI